MLRKSLVLMGLTAVSILPALADPPQPQALIDALETSYNHPKLFFTARTEEVQSPIGDQTETAAVIEQRYCRDGKKLDVTAKRTPLEAFGAANAAAQVDRYVITPESRVSLRTADGEDAMPMVMKKAPDQESRDIARSLLHGGEALDGYLAGDLASLPQVLRAAKSVTVRPEPEMVGNTSCVVVDAASKFGRYTLWVNEGNGSTVRKAEVVKNNGDQYNSLRKLGTMKIDGTPVAQTRFTMDNVAVEEVNGKPVPVRATLNTTYVLADGRNYTVRQEHARAALDLDPTFRDTDAFRMEVPRNALYTDKTSGR